MLKEKIKKAIETVDISYIEREIAHCSSLDEILVSEVLFHILHTQIENALAAINVGRILDMLLKFPFDINEPYKEYTLLMECTKRDKTGLAMPYILKYSPEVSTKNRLNGFTALHIAAAKGNSANSETLIKAGAKVEERNLSGHTALDVAFHGLDQLQQRKVSEEKIKASVETIRLLLQASPQQMIQLNVVDTFPRDKALLKYGLLDVYSELLDK